jgi:arsenate reductase
LEEAGVEFSERLYLDDPLDEGELEDLERRLGRPVTEWVRRGEQAFAEEGLTPDASTSTLRAAMARSPILMERPIVMRGERAVVGRPPEDVKTLF